MYKTSISVEFVEVYDYMRAILHSEEKSIRAFHLTERAARLNPANYTVWFYRRKIIRHLNLDLNEELRFLDEMIEMNPKNYQVWFHRQKVCSRTKVLFLEAFCLCVSTRAAKNF